MSAFGVNGKNPIAVWCPSRDAASDGSSNVADLISGRNGVLINGASWVTDGGKRALQFVASSQQYVSIADNDVFSFVSGGNDTAFSISGWLKWSSGFAPLVSKGSGLATWEYSVSAANTDGVYAQKIGTGTFDRILALGQATPALNSWHFILVSWAPTKNATDLLIHHNGFTLTNTFPTNQSSYSGMGNRNGVLTLGASLLDGFSTFLNGFIDDVRIFPSQLNATDAAYLWDSGNGRGRLSNVLNRRRREQQNGALAL
jgi:hypothetical protein